MDITLELNGTKTLTATTVDAAGNPTTPPPNATAVVWTVADPTVATVTDLGANTATLTAIGALNASTTISASDGVFTSEPVTVTISAGAAEGLTITAS